MQPALGHLMTCITRDKKRAAGYKKGEGAKASVKILPETLSTLGIPFGFRRQL